MKYFFLAFPIVFCLSLDSSSQELMTLENAVSTALEKSYSIKVVQSREAVSYTHLDVYKRQILVLFENEWL